LFIIIIIYYSLLEEALSNVSRDVNGWIDESSIEIKLMA
jgi:hypothetical protein